MYLIARTCIGFIGVVLFVLCYTLGTIVYCFFLNWYDTGIYSTEYWIEPTAAGAIIGITAFPATLHLKRKCMPSNVLWFSLITPLLGTLFLMVSFFLNNVIHVAMSDSITTIKELPQLVVGFLFMSLFYALMIAPFGAVTGLISTLFLWITTKTLFDMTNNH